MSSPLTSPCSLARAIASPIRCTNSSCSSDLGRRRLAPLQRHVQLDAAPRDLLLQHAPQPGFRGRQRGRQPQLHVEVAVVHRADGDANRRPAIFTGERRETGHGTEHMGTVGTRTRLNYELRVRGDRSGMS